MDYWKECVSEALDDAGLVATPDQINTVAYWVESAHENYGMATGLDVASANFHASQERDKDELRQRLHYEQTVPRDRCRWCSGYGYTKDGWGRTFGCNECNGKGSTPSYLFSYKPSR